MTARYTAAGAAALLLLVFVPQAPSVAAQTTCADLSGDAQAVMCTVPSGSEYLDCIHHRDAVVAAMRRNVDAQTPPEVIATIDAAAAYDCVPDGPGAGSSQPPVPEPGVPPPTTAAVDTSSNPTDDITACLPTSNIETLLGKPTKFHAGDDPQHANFTGPTGATLQIERDPTDGASVYQAHLDEGLAHPGWQLAGVDGLGDKAFAADRGGDSRSLVILEGDTAWLLHLDGVPAGSGFPQLATVAKSALGACP